MHGTALTARITGRRSRSAQAAPWWTWRAEAPLHRLLTASVYVGVDRSRAELVLAAGAGAGPLVLADAACLPLAAGAAAAVACSMSLQILQPLDRTLAEVARLLRPCGVFIALLPASGPLTLRDRLRYARLGVPMRRIMATRRGEVCRPVSG